MCPHTTTCVLILLHMCPHTTGVSKQTQGAYEAHPIHHTTTCVLILLYLCPHATGVSKQKQGVYEAHSIHPPGDPCKLSGHSFIIN